MEEKLKDAVTEPPSTATETPHKASETEPTPPRRRGGGQKRKLSNLSGGTPPTSLKRQAREKLLAAPIHNGPCTRARQQPLEPALLKTEVAPPESGLKVDEISAAQKEWEALEAKIEANYDLITSREGNAHVVPIPSGWFSWTKLHPLEERALPSFFNGKSKNRSPEIYMKIRNWIMNRFHANPSSQIELKDLSELSVGELDARQEVLEFLDYWGLINYHPLPQTDAADLTADGDGVLKTGSLVEKLYKFETEQSCTPVVPRTNVAALTVTPGLFPESTVAEELGRAEGPSVEYHCNSCSADCSRRRYHCQKEADFDLCTECFNSGKFGSYMSPSDFILMEPADAAGTSSGKWTDQETLLLLEALELFKENWSEIAEHVATKTKTQCILHFIQMPIEDTFLDRDDDMDTCAKENTDPVSTPNDALAPKDVPAIESKDDVSEDQPLSSTMEISKLEDTSEPNIFLEIGENCALKALRDAFEAVGSLPSPEGNLSFSEAGNPVMALAAFLVRLVDPNVVTASAHSSLKSVSANASGAQLATRHCFLLEDPPDDKKNSTDSERDVAKTIELEHQKDENKNDGKQNEEKPDSVLDNSDPSNDRDNGKNKDDITEEERLLVPPNGECTDKSSAPKESVAIVTHEEVEPSLPIESDNPDPSREQAPNTADESNDKTSKVEPPPSSAKESGDEASVGGTSQSTDAPKDEASVEGTSQSTDTPKDEASMKGTASQSTDAPKDEEMISDSLPPEKKEPEQPITSNPVVENGDACHTGEEEAKEANDCKNTNEDPSKTKNDIKSDKIKQASVTAISAAAVKAKLLASQEEDQIRQLAKVLVEKQLHKLETKLAFFTEMEGVVMRVREQLERSKQRLYHERAQIIAARLGMSASSSRPMQQPLPVNRTAMAFANSATRPPMSMTSQRPPISRPIMPSAPPTSNPFAPATITGNSVQPSNQDKISSVAMK